MHLFSAPQSRAPAVPARPRAEAAAQAQRCRSRRIGLRPSRGQNSVDGSEAAVSFGGGSRAAIGKLLSRDRRARGGACPVRGSTPLRRLLEPAHSSCRRMSPGLASPGRRAPGRYYVSSGEHAADSPARSRHKAPVKIAVAAHRGLPQWQRTCPPSCPPKRPQPRRWKRRLLAEGGSHH